MSLSVDDVVNDPRMAGLVKRFHTWPILQAQTVAEHSWQVVRILYAVWPNPPPRLIIAALFHDIGEIGSGDVPTHAKNRSPELKKELDALEDATHLSMCFPWAFPPPPALSEDEEAVLRFCDRMELFEHAMYEELHGNRMIEPITNRARGMVSITLFELPEACRAAASRYLVRREQFWQTKA